MTLVDTFATALGVWDEALPHVHLMVDEQEMQLVVALAGRSATPERTAGLLGVSAAEGERLLHAAYQRCLLEKVVVDGVSSYTVGRFAPFLDCFAKFGNWDELPSFARTQLDQRFLTEFVEEHRPSIECRLRGEESDEPVPNDDILLVADVEEMIDAASLIVVQPCDCRRLGQRCDRPVDTCIWFDSLARQALERGHGRLLTSKEARDLVHLADKRGLMHTGDSRWRENGLDAVCNCCACDCYPFRAARELGSKGVWPRSRYIAAYDPSLCKLCGACVKRCHFQAFFHDRSETAVEAGARPAVRYDADACWGCGLCANTCPSQAISMVPLP
jgi:NAD-dependent dihydropyrimidine dehydrogenase PreA subunit